MKRVIPLCFLSLATTFLTITSLAQSKDLFYGLQPKQKIKVFTYDDNKITGLLQSTDSSGVYIYDGGFSEWRKEQDNILIMIPYSNIRQITARRKPVKRIFYGAGTGALLGLFPYWIAPQSSGFTDTQFEIARITVPAAMTLGMLSGWLGRRRFPITGDKRSFEQFRTGSQR